MCIRVADEVGGVALLIDAKNDRVKRNRPIGAAALSSERAWWRACETSFWESALERVPVMSNHCSAVMAGLLSAVHVFLPCFGQHDVDGRDKPGHDSGKVV